MKKIPLAIIAALALMFATSTSAPAGAVQAPAVTPAVTAAAPAAAPSLVSPMVQAAQLTLRSYGYSLAVDGILGNQTTRVLRSWQQANRLTGDGALDLRTLESLGIGKQQSVGIVPAVRVTAQAPPAPAALTGCEKATAYRQQAGLPAQFDAIIYRESRCLNTVTSNTGCCVGALQVSIGNKTADGYRDGFAACGVTQRSDILGDSDSQWRKEMCVAKVLFDVSGMSPWAT